MVIETAAAQGEAAQEVMTADEIAELMTMRESVYRWFSAIYFKELTDEQIRYLAAQDFSAFEDLDPVMAEGVRDIRHALHHVNSGTREDLAVDYAHTFLAAGSGKDESRACPYESVFTSRDGLIMQEARDDVYRYMLGEHLCPSESLRIPEDHLAFVFEFMANLCLRCREAIQRDDLSEAKRLFNLQEEFFSKHIESWITMLCDAIERCCRTDFYRGISKMTRGFVKVERQLFDEMAPAIERF